MQKIAIYGAGGFGRETELLIKQINAQEPTWNFIGYFDDDQSRESNDFLGNMDMLNQYSDPLYLVIAIANGAIRRKLVSQIQNENVKFATLIHPSVIYDQNELELGEGVIIGALNVLTTNVKFGDFVILNLSCTVGHDVHIGDFSSIMPGVNISGNVKIGTETLIGTGTQILQNLIIGNGCQVGAGAVVIANVTEKTTVAGVPAKRINK